MASACKNAELDANLLDPNQLPSWAALVQGGQARTAPPPALSPPITNPVQRPTGGPGGRQQPTVDHQQPGRGRHQLPGRVQGRRVAPPAQKAAIKPVKAAVTPQPSQSSQEPTPSGSTFGQAANWSTVTNKRKKRTRASPLLVDKASKTAKTDVGDDCSATEGYTTTQETDTEPPRPAQSPRTVFDAPTSDDELPDAQIFPPPSFLATQSSQESQNLLDTSATMESGNHLNQLTIKTKSKSRDSSRHKNLVCETLSQ